MKLQAAVGALCLIVLGVSATQQRFFNAYNTGTGVGRDTGSVFDFTPLGSLDALSSEQFTNLRHPLVPDYRMRVKKSKEFCDGTVK